MSRLRSLLLAPRWARALVTVGWMAMIYLASADPDSGQESGRVLRWLLGLVHWQPGPELIGLLHHLLRKAAHFTEYAVLAALWWWSLPARSGRALWAWLLATGYATTDELHQAFVPGRGPALADVAIDSLGAAVAAFGVSRRHP